MLGIIGVYDDLPFKSSPAIVIGIDFNGNFSFLTGKNLLRIGSSCAASAGFNVFDL